MSRTAEELIRSLPLFPYVSMRRDPNGRTPLTSLGDVAHVALLYMKESGSRVVYREDLERAGLDPVDTYLGARERLARLVRARLIGVRTVQGPWQSRCLAFQHSFLAASCLVLPNLFYMAKASLKVETMCIAVPRRDILLVMPDLGPAFRAATRDLLRQRMGAADSCPLFALEPSGAGHLRDHKRSSLPRMRCPPSMSDGIPVDVEQPHDEVTSQMPMGAALATESGITSIAELAPPPRTKLAANGR